VIVRAERAANVPPPSWSSDTKVSRKAPVVPL
jgi:hypothetical protein